MHPAIEKVARAICESTAEQAGFDAESLWMEVSDGYQLDARAAIRSFIEYTRDNVSDDARDKGALAYLEDSEEGTCASFDDMERVFRAMLTALQAEIDKADKPVTECV